MDQHTQPPILTWGDTLPNPPPPSWTLTLNLRGVGYNDPLRKDRRPVRRNHLPRVRPAPTPRPRARRAHGPKATRAKAGREDPDPPPQRALAQPAGPDPTRSNRSAGTVEVAGALTEAPEVLADAFADLLADLILEGRIDTVGHVSD